MSLGEAIRNAWADTKAGVHYRLHPGRRETEANTLYYGFDEREVAFRHDRRKVVPRGKGASEDFNTEGLVTIGRLSFGEGSESIHYRREGILGERDIAVTIEHDVHDELESTKITTNQTRVTTSAGALRVARNELNLIQRLGPKVLPY